MAKATPGPWRVAYDYAQTDVMGPDGGQVALVSGDPEGQHPDLRHPVADFIAHAREDVPALVSEVESLRALLREVEWRGTGSGIGAVGYCPRCDRADYEGHEVDCRLASAIREEP